MAETTKIEWCTHTWSPWIGCTKLTAACDNCYAADMAHRYGWAEFLPNAPRHRTSASYWKQLQTWNRKAEAARKRESVFPSLCDPFDDEVDPAWRADHMAAIEATPWLEHLLLTKRAKLARQFFDGRKVPDNVRLGTTAENQKMLELRGRDIIAIKAKLLPFLSAEPALEGMDAYHGDPDPRLGGVSASMSLLGHWWERGEGKGHPGHWGFGWVIAGGESGPKARPSNPDFFRSLRDQCDVADVPFFFKQWGEWAPGDAFGMVSDRPITTRNGHVKDWMNRYVTTAEWGERVRGHSFNGHATNLVYRVGKSRAGALLDGKPHREFPS